HYHDVAGDLLESGGFPASQDADVGPDDDGDYWTWTLGELSAALADDPRRVDVARLHWGLTDSGGSMHLDPTRHVLFQALAPAHVAARLQLSEDDVRTVIETARTRLLSVRARRPTPYLDRTQYAGWVALVASGFLA